MRTHAKVELVGKITEFVGVKEINTVSYNVYTLAVSRDSGAFDYIPVYVPKIFGNLLDNSSVVRVVGKIKSYNQKNIYPRIALYVECEEMSLGGVADKNDVNIVAFVVKKPILRKTPLGRDICDLLVAVNDKDYASYIPVIAWGKCAGHSSQLDVGSKISILGRFQSRNYEKIEGDLKKSYTTHEISAFSISLEGEENGTQSKV